MDHGCDSYLFDAVKGVNLGTWNTDTGTRLIKPHGVFLRADGQVEDSQGQTGYYTDLHAYRFRAGDSLEDKKVFPEAGWDFVGDTVNNDAPHCILKRPV